MLRVKHNMTLFYFTVSHNTTQSVACNIIYDALKGNCIVPENDRFALSNKFFNIKRQVILIYPNGSVEIHMLKGCNTSLFAEIAETYLGTRVTTTWWLRTGDKMSTYSIPYSGKIEVKVMVKRHCKFTSHAIAIYAKNVIGPANEKRFEQKQCEVYPCIMKGGMIELRRGWAIFDRYNRLLVDTEQTLSWEDAERLCTSAGAHLPHVDSMIKAKELIASMAKEDPKEKAMFIGLKTEVSEICVNLMKRMDINSN